MKKETKIMIVVGGILLILLAVGIVFFMGGFTGKSGKTNLEPINSAEDLVDLVDKVYEGQENLLPSLNTRVIDVNNNDDLKYMAGLDDGTDLEYVVVSEPMMSSQAYSFILVKVKEGASANKVAKEMSEGVNPSKWMCVTAEKIYATSSGDVAILVMSSEEWGKPIYDKFKTLAGNVDREYEKTQE